MGIKGIAPFFIKVIHSNVVASPLRFAGWLLLPSILACAAVLLSITMVGRRFDGGEGYGVIGGPEEQIPIFGNINEAVALNQLSLDGVTEPVVYEGPGAGFVVVGGNSVLSAGNPLFNAAPSREGVVTYTVKGGDTLSSIAVRFGISLQTIYWANALSSSVIAPGDKLDILPVSGVRHEAKDGDTVSSIATLYGVSAQTIVDFNKVSEVLRPGQIVIVPNGKSSVVRAAFSETPHLPNYQSYYVLPTTGWNWGRLHNYNAIDIANKCGTPVYAAAEGLVLEAAEAGYNAGYGKFVRIEHPNNTKTVYAHLQSVAVGEGDLVKQGEGVGNIGNTGKTHGPTGCHLHFEVAGAKNPFAR